MTNSPVHTFKSLTKQERETIFLLNIGTFLEYFDFKTYIHIAVILNAVFFPTFDAYTSSLLAAFSFSMAYLLRPIGSLIFGLLGDLWGRKGNILITTMAMSVASFFLGVMPTYAQAGIKASIGVIACRAIQGICSAVEVTGASVYLTESIKGPRSYFFTALVWLSAGMGGVFALFCCSSLLYLRPEDGWRYVFFLGSAIAVIGMIARSTLKETPEFLEASKKYKNSQHKKGALFKSILSYKRNAIAYFLACLLNPFSFFVSVIYVGGILSQKFGYTPTELIAHNFFIVLLDMLLYCGVLYLALYINPLQIIKFTGVLYVVFAACLPLVIHYSTTVFPIFIMQVLIHCTFTDAATAIFARGFPVLGRYTLLGVNYSLARALAAVGASYACVYIGEKYEIWGVGILLAVMAITRLIGLYLFIPSPEDDIRRP